MARPENNLPRRDTSGAEVDGLEPYDGLEFASHEAAYAFYQNYAKSMGFTTSIKNSRRSKKTKEFIDAKFACSRYGLSPESDSGVSRRPSVRKTDCKASMHVKKRRDGKWYVHELVREHNHELLPALAYHFRVHGGSRLAEKNNVDIMHAVSEQTRRTYVDMCRQSGGAHASLSVRNEFEPEFERGQHLSLEEGDAEVMLEYFMRVQKESPYFFYAADLNEEQQLRNLFWVDGKSRRDYTSFDDIIFFDIKVGAKMPIAHVYGVNHHFQPLLLGCGLLADETKPSLVWLMRTWLKAMGERAPKAIISDRHKGLQLGIEEVFPYSRHCFALWHVLEKLTEALCHVLEQHEIFMKKFNKCVFKSLTDEEFDMRWWKMVSRFELQENEWVHSIYADRKKWVPAFTMDIFMAGFSTHQRSESVISHFDKFVHKKLSAKEFVGQYGLMLRSRYEEEDVADFDTWHKQPALKSPSPWEKQMSAIYTHTIFKKFQVEVLGVVGCHPRKEKLDGGNTVFRVDDCEKFESFMVTWDECKTEVSCSCLMFEYKGFLCRHAMIVLQLCGLSSIPSHYILKRWTKDAKCRAERTERIQTRVQRYNDICRRAIELAEEGSLSEENYNIACRALVEALKSSLNINNRSTVECDNNMIRSREEENELLHATKTNRKKSSIKKRKVRDHLETESEAVPIETQANLQPMEEAVSSEPIPLNGYYGSQQHVHGLLNLMEPPHDAYYVGQQSMGQLNSLSSGHDDFYGSQQGMPGLVPRRAFGFSAAMFQLRRG